MSIELPLERMTVAEKLEAMEAIWESLSAQSTDVPAPEWHGEVLADRKRRLETEKRRSLTGTRRRNACRTSVDDC